MGRSKGYSYRWRSTFKNSAVSKLIDTLKYNNGHPVKKDIPIEEKYKKLEAKMKLLQAENELLKKLDIIKRRL